MITDFFINSAIAQEAATQAASAPQNEFSFASFIPLILIFVVFYFLIIRPQSKKFKDHQAMVDSLKIGDKVVTNGGILATVKEIDSKENILNLEISEGVTIKIIRSYVSELANKDKNKKEDKKKK